MKSGHDDRRLLNHDIRNQLSNIVMMVAELRYLDEQAADDDGRANLYRTIEHCCRNIENLIGPIK